MVMSGLSSISEKRNFAGWQGNKVMVLKFWEGIRTPQQVAGGGFLPIFIAQVNFSQSVG